MQPGQERLVDLCNRARALQQQVAECNAAFPAASGDCHDAVRYDGGVRGRMGVFGLAARFIGVLPYQRAMPTVERRRRMASGADQIGGVPSNT